MMISDRDCRTLGVFQRRELEAAEGKIIALAGAGGDGHAYSQLARTFHLGEIRVADPETISIENMNRYGTAYMDTIGQPKVALFAQEVARIDPSTRVVPYPEGLTLENVEEFVDGSDLVIEEIDLGADTSLSVALYQAARRRGIAVLTSMNILHMGVATSFDPEGAYLYEDMIGVPRDVDPSKTRGLAPGFARTMPRIPWEYGDITTLEKITAGAPLPSTRTGVDQAIALGTIQAGFHLTREVDNHRPDPVWAPYWAYADAYTLKSGIARPSSAKFYTQAALAALRTRLRINPRASYDEL
jgi:hypothetical protein